MRIQHALRELKRMLLFAKIFDSLTNSLIVFLLFALFFILIKLNLAYALIPAGLYFVFHFVKNFTSLKYKDVEAQIPDMEWQIRTTADNLDKKNEIVDRLQRNVFENIQDIKTTYFFNNKSTTYKLVSITCLSLLVVLTSMFHVSFIDIKETNPTGFFAKLDTAKAKLFEGDDFDGEFEEESTRDIYGEESVYELGNDALALELQQEDSAFDPNNIRDPEQRDFTGSSSIDGIGAQSDASYEERIKSEDQEIVKNYFNQLTETT